MFSIELGDNLGESNIERSSSFFSCEFYLGEGELFAG